MHSGRRENKLGIDEELVDFEYDDPPVNAGGKRIVPSKERVQPSSPPPPPPPPLPRENASRSLRDRERSPNLDQEPKFRSYDNDSKRRKYSPAGRQGSSSRRSSSPHRRRRSRTPPGRANPNKESSTIRRRISPSPPSQTRINKRNASPPRKNYSPPRNNFIASPPRNNFITSPPRALPMSLDNSDSRGSKSYRHSDDNYPKYRDEHRSHSSSRRRGNEIGYERRSAEQTSHTRMKDYPPVEDRNSRQASLEPQSLSSPQSSHRIVTRPIREDTQSKNDDTSKIRMPLRDESPHRRTVEDPLDKRQNEGAENDRSHQPTPQNDVGVEKASRPSINKNIERSGRSSLKNEDGELPAASDTRTRPALPEEFEKKTSKVNLDSGPSQLIDLLVGNKSSRAFVARCNYYDIFIKAKRTSVWRAPEYVVERIRRASYSSDQIFLFFTVHQTQYFQGIARVDKSKSVEHPSGSERLARVPTDVPFYSLPRVPGLIDRQNSVKESFEIPMDHAEKLFILFEKFSRLMAHAFGITGFEKFSDMEFEFDEHAAENKFNNPDDGSPNFKEIDENVSDESHPQSVIQNG